MGRFPSPRYPRALQFSLPNWTGLAGRDVGIRKISLQLAEMADAEQSIPDINREAAEEVRQLARRARLTDIRSDLLELSARFERLAAYADAAIRLGAPGYPHGERLPAAGDCSDRARAADCPLSSGSRPHFESANLNLPASDSNRADRERASGSAHAAGKS